MSGIIGHTTYAILAAKAAGHHRLPIAPILHRHFASYLAGSYLGSDVQTLPAAVCQDTSQEVGYCAARITESPITGGPVTPWKLSLDGAEYTPLEIHHRFYGRAHLVFGWQDADRELAVAWDDVPRYLAAVVGDALELFGPGERKLAYVFGWLTHVAGDSLIKSVQPGITLHLLDGKYTPRNRPVQDLVSFHEIGRKELRIDWPSLLADLVDTPVEPIQLHFMRVAKPRGRLADFFPEGWKPEDEPLVARVLAENRHYQRIRNGRILEELALKRTPAGWQCDASLSDRTGGLTYAEMVEAAEAADFRHALWQMGEAIVDLFVRVIQEEPTLANLPADSCPTWHVLSARWRKQ